MSDTDTSRTVPSQRAIVPVWARREAAELKERFSEVFDRIAEEAVGRERQRRLPFDAVELLRSGGFTAATVPRDLGGLGAGRRELFELLATLAQADSNVAHLFRSHFAYVDGQLLRAPGTERERALGAVAGGLITANASHERGPAAVGSYTTTLLPAGEDYVLDGRKYYSTGSLFADQINVGAVDEQGQPVRLTVPADLPGITRIDDWDGFGQRLTGSGTTVFDQVRIPSALVPREPRGPFQHGGAFLQLVLLAVMDGIGRAALSDAATFLRRRSRVYSHAGAEEQRHDPISLEVIGEISALSFQAATAVRAAAEALDCSAAAIQEVNASPEPSDAAQEQALSAIQASEEAVATAQNVVIPAVLTATTIMFDVGGASALAQAHGLDRHWRNARSLASHNPHRYKARLLGDWLVNEKAISNGWQVGESRSASS